MNQLDTYGVIGDFSQLTDGTKERQNTKISAVQPKLRTSTKSAKTPKLQRILNYQQKAFFSFIMNGAVFATFLLSLGVYAMPQPDAVTITEGENTFTGIDKGLLTLRNLEPRCDCFPCYSPHADCEAGKCQCAGDYGCWSCNGGRMQCQPGPGSGQCWT